MGWMPNPPDPNPGTIASAQISSQVAEDQISLSRDQFNWSKEQDQRNWATISPLIQQQGQIAQQQEDRSQDYYNYEKGTFRPLEQSMVNEAENFDTDAERERQAGLASSDVSQQMAVQRDSASRNLERYGINPNSGKFAAVNADMSTSEGLARAGAANQARFNARQMGFAMKEDAAGLGRNLAPNATAAANTALAGDSSAINGQLNGSSVGAGMRNAAIANYMGAQQGLSNSAAIGNMNFGQAMQGYQANMGQLQTGIGAVGAVGSLYASGALGSMASTIGSWGSALLAFLKDGGEVGGEDSEASGEKGGTVSGPGTSTSDSIPAMLSKGEYVIPAPVVKRLGINHFDKLIEQHGSPDNVAALQTRRAGLRGHRMAHAPRAGLGMRG